MNKATVLSPYAASLTLRRTGLNFIFSANRGCAATPLHPCLRADAPYRGFKFRSLRSPTSDLPRGTKSKSILTECDIDGKGKGE